MNKNDILARLQNGESLETIGQELANIMNEANAEYMAAEKAKAEAEAQKNAVAAKKRMLAEDFINVLREYATLYDGETQAMLNEALEDSDYDEMVEAIDGLFDLIASLRELKAVLGNAPVKPVTSKKSHELPVNIRMKTDDEKLAEFLSSILG